MIIVRASSAEEQPVSDELNNPGNIIEEKILYKEKQERGYYEE